MMHRRKFLRGAAFLGAYPLVNQARLEASESHIAPNQLLDRTGPQPLTNEDALAIAAENIKNFRQPSARIKVLLASGKPAKGLQVKLSQTKSDFLFGEPNVGLDALAQDGLWESRKGVTTRKVVADLFNALNNTCYWTEKRNNSMKKVEDQQGDTRLESFAKVVEWANSVGITCKGHPLFWPVDKAIPRWLDKYDYPTQLHFLEVRIRSMVSRFKGQVRIWDLVNEMMWEPALKNLKSRNWPHLESEENLVEYISLLIKWAKEEDPTGLFLLNEYGVEADEKPNLKDQYGKPASGADQRRRYISLVKALAKNGTPIDAIGLQSHSGDQVLSPLAQYNIYKEFSTAGVPIHVTEFWLPHHLTKPLRENDGKDLALQKQIADQLCTYVTQAFGTPEVGAFFGWAINRSLYEIDDDGSVLLFEAYHRLQDLLQHQWRTTVTLKTDEEGFITLKGFEGQYDLTYQHGQIRTGTTLHHTRTVSQHQILTALH